jgi:hypothetical protein
MIFDVLVIAHFEYEMKIHVIISPYYIKQTNVCQLSGHRYTPV